MSQKFQPGDIVRLVDYTGSTGIRLMASNPSGIFTVLSSAPHKDDPNEEMLTVKEHSSGEMAYATRFKLITRPLALDAYEGIIEAQEVYEELVK